MKLTKEQKNQIYNKNMIVDEWEWVPCINHVLRILNYDDTLEHDENYEEVKWSGTEPLIKDEKIRKAVRAWAEANGLNAQPIYFSAEYNRFCDAPDFSIAIDFYREVKGGPHDGYSYYLGELCGEEEE